MAMRRSGKFYRTNEAEVMAQLGLRPTKGSGSGWIEKEDGQSEHIICQLKSTDAQSIKVAKQDLDTLQYNAAVSHKLPVFAIQYLSSNEVYLVLRPEVLSDVARYLETGEAPQRDSLSVELAEIARCEDVVTTPVTKVKSSQSAREAFRMEHQSKYAKRRKSAL